MDCALLQQRVPDIGQFLILQRFKRLELKAPAPWATQADLRSGLALPPTRSENQIRFWTVSRLRVWPTHVWPDAAQRTAKTPAAVLRFLKAAIAAFLSSIFTRRFPRPVLLPWRGIARFCPPVNYPGNISRMLTALSHRARLFPARGYRRDGRGCVPETRSPWGDPAPGRRA